MRDECFELFIQEFGEATTKQAVPASSIPRWQGRLPDQLIKYWEEEGWCGYGNGLFWTVNPDDYEDIVDEWLEGTPLEQADAYHVIARSAFGDLYLYPERSNNDVTLSCPIHTIVMTSSKFERASMAKKDRAIMSFFAVKDKTNIDLDDEKKRPLFERALKKLGPLAADEMYGFEPALIAGGRMMLENLSKVKIDQHLTILRQFGAPKIPNMNFDLEKFLKEQN